MRFLSLKVLFSCFEKLSSSYTLILEKIKMIPGTTLLPNVAGG